MNQKAIRLSWVKDIAGNNIEASEYFVPYSYEILQELSIFEDHLGQGNGICRCADGFKAHNNNELIVDVDDNKYINDPNDIYAPSAWDYYSDANVVIRLRKAKGEIIEELQELSVKEMLSRELMFRAKIDISILLNIEVDSKYVNYKIADYCHKHKLDEKKFRNVINDQLKDYPEAKSIMRFFNEKFQLYRYLQSLKKLYRLDGYSIESSMKCAINDGEFSNEKIKIVRDIIDIICCGKFSDDYKKRYGVLCQKEYYKEFKCRCYAMMEEDGKKTTYFALSGVWDYNGDIKLACKDIVVNILYALTGKKCLAKDILNPFDGYQWAYLKDNVLSYIDVSKPYDKNNITYGSSVVDLAKCVSDCGGWEKFVEKGKNYYSCCERKLFAHGDVATDKMFYVRWAPCDRCIPAFMLTKGKKTVYSFARNGNKRVHTYNCII